MIVVPSWLTFSVAGLVIVFGLFRLYLSTRPKPPEDRPQFSRKGLYGMSRRRHLLFAIIYLILGAFLIASALGVRLSPFQATGG